MSEDKDLILIFSISGCKYAIGLRDLIEVKESSALLSKGDDEGSLGRIAFRGDSIPLLDIKKRLGLPSDVVHDAGSVVVRVGEAVFAFPVDMVEGVMEVYGKQMPFPDVMLEEKGVFPFIYMREGKFVFSLNLAALFDSDYIAHLNVHKKEGE
ncbi:MAG: chemotaxis protein CheW [bacterium]|nr:chemotaxis protein CheW [bacterium]